MQAAKLFLHVYTILYLTLIASCCYMQYLLLLASLQFFINSVVKLLASHLDYMLANLLHSWEWWVVAVWLRAWHLEILHIVAAALFFFFFFLLFFFHTQQKHEFTICNYKFTFYLFYMLEHSLILHTCIITLLLYNIYTIHYLFFIVITYCIYL